MYYDHIPYVNAVVGLVVLADNELFHLNLGTKRYPERDQFSYFPNTMHTHYKLKISPILYQMYNR